MPKNSIQQTTILATQSGATSKTSSIVDIQNLDNIGIQVDLTGTLTGTLAVNVSLNHKENSQKVVIVAGTFAPLLLTYNGTQATGVAITSGSPSPVILDLNQLSAPYIELVWTATSGTGNITAVLSAKSV